MEATVKRKLILLAKTLVSAGIMALIFQKVFEKQDAATVWGHVANMSWTWIVIACAMQLIAIGCSVTRWHLLLVGQGIHAPPLHLFNSFMIGRFFGAITPGGWTGLNGYRFYDIAKYTGKTARSGAAIGIEMLLGQVAVGAVVIIGSIYGLRYIGVTGVVLVNLFFLGMIVGAVAVLSRPLIFRRLGEQLPAGLRRRLQSTVDAVCAYHGKGKLVAGAAFAGMGTHAFNNLVYVATARALGVDLGVGELFFAVAMQILPTLVPATVNGIGIREATMVVMLARVGVPIELATLLSIVGFCVEMFISAFGGLLLVARSSTYKPAIRVDDPDRDDLSKIAFEEVPRESWPSIARATAIGLGAGLVAGMLLGIGEGLVVVLSAGGEADYSVLAYGAGVYGVVWGLLGAAVLFASALSGRWLRREAVPEAKAYARTVAAMVAVPAFAIGAFRIRRDVFHEELVWKSGQGLLVLGGAMLGAAAIYFALSYGLRFVVTHRPFRFMLRAWGSPAFAGVVFAAIFAGTLAVGQRAVARPGRPQNAAPSGANNVLFIVVDTLRADHLPAYGYSTGRTPNLDAFAQDAVRFEHAYANASWTRPSFASMLTGRYASSHQTMAKPDALPDSVVTLAEAFSEAGYSTAGFVTNYNVAPFFNFHQGFDEYRYLEPNFVLGANDSAAKLLFIQFARQTIEKLRAARGIVEPGTAYQDAETVNRELFSWLGRAPRSPWLLFVGYMDPHDPYFPHPYDGRGYSRAANPNPRVEDVPMMKELYDGEITYWDEHFGALIAELKRRGVYDDMTIVVTSDHGEEFHDHGGFWHGTTLYDEQLAVPLFVKLPMNARGGSVVSHWVQSIDIMPTLLTQNGIESIPDGVQGVSLFVGHDETFAEESHEGNVLSSVRMRRGASELKIIEANPGNPRGLPERELFRVDMDRGEHVNLSDEQPRETELASRRLGEIEDLATRGRVERQETNMANANAERLRALGYAGGADTPAPRTQEPTPRDDADRPNESARQAPR